MFRRPTLNLIETPDNDMQACLGVVPTKDVKCNDKTTLSMSAINFQMVSQTSSGETVAFGAANAL